MVQVETLILLETQIQVGQQHLQITQDLQIVQTQVEVLLTQIIQGLQTLHHMLQLGVHHLQILQTLLEILIQVEAQVGQQVITPRLQT